MEKQKLEQHLFHNKLNYLEKIILFIFLNQNNIKINIYDIEKFFLLKKRENTIVGFYSDFYISNLLKIENNLIFEDTISFLINKIIYLDYSISIENELINIEGFTYDYNIPELIENVEVYKATWKNGVKKLKEKLEIPIIFETFSILEVKDE